MKLCPKCRATYDDSWGVCLKCGAKLSAAAEEISGTRLSEIGDHVRRIEDRLAAVEKKLGIEPPPAKPVAVPERPVAAPVAAPSAARRQPAEGPRDIESTIGLVWFNRIGLLALLLGITFFLKYAFGNRWIGELGRVIIGLGAGFGLIVAGEFCRRKNYPVIAQGLNGGGASILYLSIFAAFGFYHLIGALPALVFMSFVTLYCGVWSVRTDWVSAAVIGILGGFLTPLLLWSDALRAPVLFSYVLLLDLGVLYIASRKRWNSLNLGAFFLTHTVYFAWYNIRYRPESLFFTMGAATAFFATFCLLSIVRNLLHRERSEGVDLILVLSNGLMYFSQLFLLLKPKAGAMPGILPLGLGCLYIAYSYSALTRCREDKHIIAAYAGLAVTFVTIAVPVQLKFGWVATAWAAEALVLIWLGFRLTDDNVRKFGLFVAMLAVFEILLFEYSYDPASYSKYAFIFNERMFTYAVVVAALFAGARLYRRNAAALTAGEKEIATALVLIANGILLVQFTVEAQNYYAHAAYLTAYAQAAGDQSAVPRLFQNAYRQLFSGRELTTSLLWIIYALILTTAGIYQKFRALRLMALCLFGAAVLKIFLFDLSQLDRIYRIISFITLGAVLMVVSFFYQKYRDRIHDFAMKD